MKKLLFACLTVLFMVSCGPKNYYSINGVVADSNADGATLFIYNANREPIDSVVVSNGSFSFEGIVDEAFVGFLVGSNDLHTWQCQTLLVVEPGKIHVDLDCDSVFGTPLNDAYNAILLKHDFKAVDAKISKMYDDLVHADSVSQLAMEGGFEKYYEEVYTPLYETTMRDMMENNPDNVLGLFSAKNLAIRGMLTVSDLEQKMSNPNGFFAKDSVMQEILVSLRNLEATSEGHHFADFECILPSGEMGHLSDVIAGKLALVDFWASWCAPCREEISTNLIRLSKQYAKQGLLVVGVDVWDQIDKHAAAVEKLGIPYPQVIDTTLNATDLYGIQGIPQIMLVAPDGTILARELRGDAIEDAIVNALK